MCIRNFKIDTIKNEIKFKYFSQNDFISFSSFEKKQLNLYEQLGLFKSYLFLFSSRFTITLNVLNKNLISFCKKKKKKNEKEKKRHFLIIFSSFCCNVKENVRPIVDHMFEFTAFQRIEKYQTL